MNDPTKPEVLDAEGAAALLGIHKNTLYAACRRKELPHRKIGRGFFFSRKALLQWLEGEGMSNE